MNIMGMKNFIVILMTNPVPALIGRDLAITEYKPQLETRYQPHHLVRITVAHMNLDGSMMKKELLNRWKLDKRYLYKHVYIVVGWMILVFMKLK